MLFSHLCRGEDCGEVERREKRRSRYGNRFLRVKISVKKREVGGIVSSRLLIRWGSKKKKKKMSEFSLTLLPFGPLYYCVGV